MVKKTPTHKKICMGGKKLHKSLKKRGYFLKHPAAI